MSREAVISVARQRLAFWSAVHTVAKGAVDENLGNIHHHSAILEAYQRVAAPADEEVQHWRKFVVPVPKPVAR